MSAGFLLGGGESGGGFGGDLEDGAFCFLQVGDDVEEVAGLWVAGGAEHAHEALGRAVECCTESKGADGSVDVLPEDGFSGFEVSGDHAGYGFREQGSAEVAVLFEVGLDGFGETAGGHEAILLTKSSVTFMLPDSRLSR